MLIQKVLYLVAYFNLYLLVGPTVSYQQGLKKIAYEQLKTEARVQEIAYFLSKKEAIRLTSICNRVLWDMTTNWTTNKSLV